VGMPGAEHNDSHGGDRLRRASSPSSLTQVEGFWNTLPATQMLGERKSAARILGFAGVSAIHLFGRPRLTQLIEQRRDADSIKVLSLGLGLEQRDGFVALAACVEHLRLEFDGSPAIRFLLFQPSQPSLRLLGLI